MPDITLTNPVSSQDTTKHYFYDGSDHTSPDPSYTKMQGKLNSEGTPLPDSNKSTYGAGKSTPVSGGAKQNYNVFNANGPGWTSGTKIPKYQDPTKDQWQDTRNFINSDSFSDYKSFLSDIYSKEYDTDRMTSLATKAPMSIANRYSLFTWWGLHGEPSTSISKFYRDGLLKNGGNSRVRPNESDTKLNTAALIEYFSDATFGGIEYSWSDFLWAKYHRYISNNYLLTLRRFPHPCVDNIYFDIQTYRNSTTKTDTDKKTGETTTTYIKPTGADGKPDTGTTTGDITVPDIARAVTWMSEAAGNKMEDILNFTYGYNWREQTATTNTYESQKTGYTAQPFYQKMGLAGKGFFDMLRGLSPAEVAMRNRMSGHDPLKETYENFVLGPINVINKMWTRDVGLKFDQEIKLTFEYKLMSYAGINPRVAFLDIMANLLVLTYSNANFWGGANRFYGGGGYVAKEFGDLQELAKGNYKNYLVSVVQEMGGGFSAVFGDIKTGAFDWSIPGILQGLQTLGGQLMGSFMGNFINKQIGALPAYQATQAFISGEPTGDWHLTIGNPINPIMMIGNLILEDSQLTFGGGLGWDDFPLELKLVVTLKHAKPRDKSDFESAFNAGKGRLYAGMSAIGDVLNLEGKDVATYGSLSKIDTGLNRITFDKVGNDDMRKHKISVDDAIDVGKIATSKEAYAAIEKRFSGWIKNKKGAATDFITMSMARIGR